MYTCFIYTLSAGSGIEGAVPVFARPVDEQLPVPPTRRASLAVKKTADPEAMARNVEELMSMDCSEVCHTELLSHTHHAHTHTHVHTRAHIHTHTHTHYAHTHHAHTHTNTMHAHKHTHTHIQILQLLDAMNMTRYKTVFEEEGVDGEILAECDEEVLQAELQVTSKIHRSKLMGVIKGHQSAVYIVTNSDYY